MTHISSPANPTIKWLASLHKPRKRRAEKLVVVEGAKEVLAARKGGLRPHSLFTTSDTPSAHNAAPNTETAPVYTVTASVYARVAYRDTSDGIIGVFHEPDTSLDALPRSKKDPIFLVLEGVEKPGNVGAIIRTADGAGVDGVILADERCDLWNPNAIRASVGTIFTTPIARATNAEVLEYLQTHHITPYAAALSPHAIPYVNHNYTSATAFVLGTEHYGLSDFWTAHAQHIIIPMHGINDSLNVSVAAGILAYEARRQRG